MEERVKSKKDYGYTVLFEPAAEGGYVVTCPALPGLVWFDRPVMSEPFLTSVEGTIQWVFNRTGSYVQIVISASHDLSSRSQQEISYICRCELDDLLPGARGAQLQRTVVVRVNAATSSPAPGSD